MLQETNFSLAPTHSPPTHQRTHTDELDPAVANTGSNEASGRVYINEVHFHPPKFDGVRSFGKCVDPISGMARQFIELHNPSNVTIRCCFRGRFVKVQMVRFGIARVVRSRFRSARPSGVRWWLCVNKQPCPLGSVLLARSLTFVVRAPTNSLFNVHLLPCSLEGCELSATGLRKPVVFTANHTLSPNVSACLHLLPSTRSRQREVMPWDDGSGVLTCSNFN